jgi:hypothetical protein
MPTSPRGLPHEVSVGFCLFFTSVLCRFLSSLSPARSGGRGSPDRWGPPIGGREGEKGGAGRERERGRRGVVLGRWAGKGGGRSGRLGCAREKERKEKERGKSGLGEGGGLG